MKKKYQITIGIDKSEEMVKMFEHITKISTKIGFTMKANKNAQKIIDANTEKIK